MPHELTSAFEHAGLPLCPVLAQMLDEHPRHRTLRRGCGLTQSTRYLATCINRPRDPGDPQDLAMFASLSPKRVAVIAAHSLDSGWAGGWRGLEHAPAPLRTEVSGLQHGDVLLSLPSRLDAIAAALSLEESHRVIGLIRDILGPGSGKLPRLPAMAEKPEIGSCSQAEEFFLEIAHGKIRRGGQVNIWVDDQRRPVLVEKMGLGESHSALFVGQASICGVDMPPASLAALRPAADVVAVGQHPHGQVLPLSGLAEVRFLRLTTLSVSPAARERAFSSQFRRQVVGNMLSPATTTLDDLREYVQLQLRQG